MGLFHTGIFSTIIDDIFFKQIQNLLMNYYFAFIIYTCQIYKK